MNFLEEKIVAEAIVIDESILKVDRFINQQIDTALLARIAAEFAGHFKNENVTKIMTMEASGIAFAVATALQMGNIPVVFAKKGASKLSDEVYSCEVFSFTKKQNTTVWVNRACLRKDERILIIDDFLAEGHATQGLIDIAGQAQAKVVGIGIVIEKSFQGGRKLLQQAGYEVFSLAKIASLAGNKVTIK